MSLVPFVQRLEARDTTTLELGGVALAALDLRELRRYVDAYEVRLAARLAVLGEPVIDLLRKTGSISTARAAEIERAAQTTAAVPALGVALDERRIGIDHVAAYRRVGQTLSDDQRARLAVCAGELLDAAGAKRPEQFARAVAAVARELRDDDGEHVHAQQRNDRSLKWGYRGSDRMGYLSGVFDPETAARLFALLQAQTDRLLDADPSLTKEQAAADALTDYVLNSGRTKHHGRTEVVVFVDWESLLGGAHLGGVSYLSNGTHLPVSTVRRLCCEAQIIPMVLGGDGQPLDVGYESRFANRAQRRALRKLYKTCAHPDCDVSFDHCDVHHVDWWEHRGPTDLANLLPLCSRHHHLVHEGGWRLTIDTRRTINVHRPDGTHWRTEFWAPPAGEHPQRRRPPDRHDPPDPHEQRPPIAA